jgi:hypothetical protein
MIKVKSVLATDMKALVAEVAVQQLGTCKVAYMYGGSLLQEK